MATKKTSKRKANGSAPRGTPPERGEPLPHPSVPRALLAGHGKPVTVEVDASGAGPGHRYVRADIELLELDHSGASYEGRVFLNNPKASAKTPLEKSQGYAGRFYVFGHGQCFGDAGHCDVPVEYRDEDRRRAHPLDPVVRRITATEAVREAAAKKNKLKITIVPVLQAATVRCDLDDVVKFERLRLVTYNA